jgi:hypothetical protein
MTSPPSTRPAEAFSDSLPVPSRLGESRSYCCEKVLDQHFYFGINRFEQNVNSSELFRRVEMRRMSNPISRRCSAQHCLSDLLSFCISSCDLELNFSLRFGFD